MRQNTTLLMVAVAALGTCLAAHASPIVIETWGGAGTDNWSRQDQFGSPGTSIVGDPTAPGYLRITGGDPFNNPSEATIFSQDSGYVGQNYQSYGGGVKSVRFDFYAANAPAGGLQLYFVGAGGVTWYYTLSPTLGWNHYAVNLNDASDSSGWYSATHTWNQFYGDLSSVSEIGIYLTYTLAGGSQVYGIDQFELNDQYLVPEPSTYAMLGVALLSLAFTFRRKLQDMLVRADTGSAQA